MEINSGAAPAWSSPQRDLPREVQLAVLSRLPANEIPLSARLTCKAAAQHFSEPHRRTVDFSQPLPPHAASAPLPDSQSALRCLTITRKLSLLSTAAATGCEANLEVALRLLSGCLFPELLRSGFYVQIQKQRHEPDRWGWAAHEPYTDAGTVAMLNGRLGVLSWLLRRCPSMFDHQQALEVAARHRPLPQLQEVWRLLGGVGGGGARLDDGVLDAAAESHAPDAVEKMEWVLEAGSGGLRVETAAAAARSGDLARLRWLRERGCPFDSQLILAEALQHADLPVVEWLAGEAGCPLPGPGPEDGFEVGTLVAAAAASGSVAKLRWLQARGVALAAPPPEADGPLLRAAGAGQLETVRFLHQQEDGDQLLSAKLLAAAVSSCSIETANYLLQAGCPVIPSDVWQALRPHTDLAMVRWLLDVAHAEVSCAGFTALVYWWSDKGAQGSTLLMDAVRLMAPASSHPPDDMPDLLSYSAGVWYSATLRGELGLLRYLHEEMDWGMDGNPIVCRVAAMGGCEAVLEWLVQGGGQGREARGWDGCYTAAAKNGDLGTLECLWRLGLRWGEGFPRDAMRSCPLPVLRWVWAKAPPPAALVRRALKEAAAGAAGWLSVVREEVIAWLQRQLAGV